MTRRESREVAFLLLFEWSFGEEDLQDIIRQAVDGRDVVVDDFALSLVSRAVDNRLELDGLITRYSEKWKLNRISKVTLAALRLSFCELSQFADIPVGATINEAVELVKKFSTEDEAAYVNGILGSFVRDQKPEEA